MFYQKIDSFCQGVILTVIGQYTFLIFFLFLDERSLIHFFFFFFFFDRQRWAAILVEIAKVKEEIHNTCRNCQSKRIVRGSKRQIFKVQVLIKEYATSVHNNC